MDLLNIDDFTADTLQYLIDNEVEENVHLDYKAGTALQKNDRGKNEITKDISAFANIRLRLRRAESPLTATVSNHTAT